jgi:hypothetical protein
MYYLFAASCLTALIVFQDQQANSGVTDAIVELEIAVRGLDREFCETINEMHRIRGFEVLDCSKGAVKVRRELGSTPESQ